MSQFLSGAIFITALLISVYFLRFWRTSKEPFFGYFALAFALLALERLVLAAIMTDQEASGSGYVIRLVAYATILFAIWVQNRRPVSTT